MLRYDPLIDHQRILGQHFVNSLSGTDNFLIRDGKRYVTKHELVKLGTGNFLAARRVFSAMKKMRLNSVMDFFRMRPEHIAEIKGIGTTGLYVLICIGRARGVNIDTWFKPDVTFETLKHDAKLDSEERESKQKARSARQKREAALTEAGTHVLRTAKTTRRQLSKSA